MSVLGRYKQQTGERRKRGLDYERFLEDGETLTDVDAEVVENTTTTPLVVNGIVIDPEDEKSFIYFVSGGEDNTEYSIKFTVTTSGGQTLEDNVDIEVEDV